MTLHEYLQMMERREPIVAGSPAHEIMHHAYGESQRITTELNSSVHTQKEVTALLSRLTGTDVHPTVYVISPFQADFGKNIHLGKHIYINAGCKFQDHGGIHIDDDVLVGHNCVMATLNHDERPDHRADMTPAPIHICRNVWIGANVTILGGVTIGENAIVAAGAVVTKDVAPNTIVAGVPAREIRKIKTE